MKALPSLARPLLAHHPAPTSNQPPVRSPLASPDSSPRLPRTTLSTPQAPVGPRRGLAYRQVPLTFCSVDEYVNECYVLASDLQSFPMALGAQAAGQFSALWTRPLAIGLDHVTLSGIPSLPWAGRLLSIPYTWILWTFSCPTYCTLNYSLLQLCAAPVTHPLQHLGVPSTPHSWRHLM